MSDVKVYDKKNPDRFLGTLKVSDENLLKGDSYQVAVLGRMAANPYDFRSAIVLPKVDRLTFYKGYKNQTERYKDSPTMERTVTFSETIFMTNATLEELMGIDPFTLPGESAWEAASRRGY